jgi:TDG/mug DNA glycosylase family protein
MGRQSETIGESELWVLPNPSGLNAHESIDSLATWYRKGSDAAGITTKAIA